MLLIAPPGAGKGTQAERISSQFGIPHVSTGDLFRQEVLEATAIGTQVKDCIDAGDLVPDATVMSLVRDAVAGAVRTTGGYLLDGFPRNLAQAQEGYRMAKELDATVQAVIHYDAPDDVLVERLLSRGSAGGRSDDNEAVIRHRLDVYHTQTEPLLEYYRRRAVLITVNADRAPDDVTADSIAAVTALLHADAS